MPDTPHDDASLLSSLPDDSADQDAESTAQPAPSPGESRADQAVPASAGPLIDEPPLAEEDTRPRVPEEALSEQLTAEEPPLDSLMDTAEILVHRPAARPLLLIVVMASTLCLCIMLVSLAGFAGYRDGLATNDAKVTQTLATGIAEQYATGVADLQQGYAEMAAARFAWIVETIQAPTQYALDSPGQLALARTIEAYSPTPSPAPTQTLSPTFTPTSPPTLMPSMEPTATLLPMQDPAYLYDQAALAMQVTHYEEAISWLDALRALAPDYRAAEARAMLIEALTKQGRIYLRGQNTDGEDMLARGVLLIYRADELGPVEPPDLLGEANFVEMYINARNYVTGGDYARALPVLEELCRINCGWSYHGVSVQDLLDSAQAGGSTP
jgi:hypothetical protein